VTLAPKYLKAVPEGLVEGVDVGPHLVLPVLVPYQPAQFKDSTHKNSAEIEKE
jgi:hypothetical protein